ncbi:MAG TPA: chemotaxis protein CheA [Burkholderiaceae bacterium]|nr:chemotaxis protein CheA [Burkholderiaceae bacterium]
MNDDEKLLQATRSLYMDEARDMLEQFETALLALEETPQDAETLNAAFRAAHTIKGSSGVFGLKAIVRFTHDVEAVLDAMRIGEIVAAESTIALLLQCCDRIGTMVAEVGGGAADATPVDGDLPTRLAALLQATAAPAAPAAPATAAVEAPVATGAGTWHLSLRFKADALRNGFDPLSFLRYLPRVGTVVAIATLVDSVPSIEDIDPEACYLGFEIRLATSADRATIEGVFEFAREDCTLQMIPPGSRVEECLRLIESYGEEPAIDAPLGRILVEVGALTEHELADLLRAQVSIATDTVAAVPRLGEIAVAAGAATPQVVRAAVERQETLRARGRDEARMLRVSADKLDRLIDLIGELVIAASGAQLAAQQERSAPCAEAAERIAGLVEAARDGALQLRMVQIGETFARFQRVVRDNAKALGKDVELAITGGETELDKSMVEMIADPLMHLVRNSVDHGVEAAADRVAAGKPARGRIVLNAYHDSGSIVIEVGDDGRGLDRERIRAKAIERGIVTRDQHLDDEEIHDLVFAPGLSTASQVTDLSGRGVGMDVVKRNIEALRGTVRLSSTPGRGATTQIRLPLTLAIIDGFLVSVGDVHYVVPLEMVVECVELPQARTDGRDGCTGYFDLRGEVLPFLDVRKFFALDEIGGMDAPGGSRRSVVVVRYGPNKIGLLVDGLLGEHQTVIKPLGTLFSSLRGIAGSTVLGSGEIALIFDVPGLVGAATRGRRQALSDPDPRRGVLAA